MPSVAFVAETTSNTVDVDYPKMTRLWALETCAGEDL